MLSVTKTPKVEVLLPSKRLWKHNMSKGSEERSPGVKRNRLHNEECCFFLFESFILCDGRRKTRSPMMKPSTR